MQKKFIFFLLASVCYSCKTANKQAASPVADSIIKPVVITEKVFDDSDDPAFWINEKNKNSSFIVGTDKNSKNGGLYVFNLQGKIDTARTLTGLHRMNNVDIAYGLKLGNVRTDIAVATERDQNTIRIFSLPLMKAIDGGGIEVFKGEKQRAPMGIALYTRPKDKAIFAIVSRKDGPAEGYLEQYILKDNGTCKVVGELVRKFGRFSGKKEIESIAVDNELGYVYYSDEQAGIRKYYADPDKGNEELALFGKGEYKEDNEGVSIYKFKNGTGYILVSDQSANRFNVYSREGGKSNKHLHTRIASIPVSTNQSDGSEVTSISLPGFKGGLFVAMSTDKTFHYYRWSDLANKAGLRVNSNK
jgi:3-phytase